MTPELMAARLGKVTASRMADLCAKTKSGYAASRRNYLAQLVAERLSGTPQESYTNAAMQWGIDTEPHAADAYSFHTGLDLDVCGFFDHPTIPQAGASPDRLVGNDGLVEIKCPNTATHIDTLLDDFVPRDYVLQIQWQLACTGRQWCDFVSFDPRLPERLRLFIARVNRDPEKIAELEKEVRLFLRELEGKIAALELVMEKAA
jgi:putative phage-type endonuclease